MSNTFKASETLRQMALTDRKLSWLGAVAETVAQMEEDNDRMLRDIDAYRGAGERYEQELARKDAAIAEQARQLKDALAQVERYKAWVDDLQSGMYVNCVYCGHRYGPTETTPVSMADALKEHIEHCPEHPASKLRSELEQVKRERDAAVRDVKNVVTHYPCYVCKHSQYAHGCGCDITANLQREKWNCRKGELFVWRGPCAENGGTEDGI